MAKDSYWFRHDSTAGRGLRLRKIAHVYSHWGKGVYWDVIEILREQDNYSYPKDESSLQMLASLIGCNDATKFINWYKDCVKINLLQENEEAFFSEVLCHNMKKWETTKVAGVQSGKSRNERKTNEPPNETRTKAPTDGEHKIREDKIREEKKRSKPIPFSESQANDKIEFAKQLSGWSKDKLKYYYDSALTWSNEGNKKIDWIATVKTWASRDEKEGKIKFKEDSVKKVVEEVDREGYMT